MGRANGLAVIASSEARQQARNPFMSVAPRPMRRPARSRRTQGSPVQGWPCVGTMSVWPLRTTPTRFIRPDRDQEVRFIPRLIREEPGPRAVRCDHLVYVGQKIEVRDGADQ